ncbi:hypothetical protein NC651_018501 [Populus alba x Populus x berolinensis]|nr:hypothetical protein NC651_018501 [Populus alba x Populus x berolinensis]
MASSLSLYFLLYQMFPLRYLETFQA